MDAVLSLIQNPIVLTLLTVGVGILVKYHPKLKNVPNWTIPYLNVAVSLITQLFGPATAHAGILGAIGAHIGFLSPVVTAGWQAVKSALFYEVFLRGPLNVAGVTKAIPSVPPVPPPGL